MNAPLWLLAVIAIAFLVLAALLSAGESAVARVTRADLAELSARAEDDPRRARKVARAQALAADPRGVGASASIVRVLAEVVVTVCVTLAVAQVVGTWWGVLLVATLIGWVLALVLVRISPRTVGRTHAPGVLVSLSGLLGAVVAATPSLQRLVKRSLPTPEEEVGQLREMVERTGESDSFEDEDRELIRSVFELGDTMVREVMVPRTDMITVPADASLDKALRLFARSGYSRVPVTGDSTDDVRGVLYFKDVVRDLIAHPAEQASRTAADVARDAVFVPESLRADDLLRQLQTASNHIALVVDEYGGIAGLVTIEDALEEIVGELTDEHDRAAPEVEDLGDGTYRVPSRLGLDDLGDLFGVEIQDDDVDTVGGLLAKAIGKVPIVGSRGEAQGIDLVADRFGGRRRQLATVLASRAAPHHADAPDEEGAPESPEGPAQEHEGHEESRDATERAHATGRGAGGRGRGETVPAAVGQQGGRTDGTRTGEGRAS